MADADYINKALDLAQAEHITIDEVQDVMLRFALHQVGIGDAKLYEVNQLLQALAALRRAGAQESSSDGVDFESVKNQLHTMFSLGVKE